ncbi:MAG: lysostaphin resistance A-like protein [Marmoricola sp.]
MSLRHVAPVTHREPAAVVEHRRRVVGVVATIGAGMLGASLSTQPGSRRFYASTLAVAAVWLGGGAASGPLHRGWVQGRDRQLRRPVLTPVATGVAAFGFFAGAATVASRIPVLDRAVGDVMAFAEQGTDRWVLATALANGAGEEVFFRGALYTALADHHPVVSSTAVYTVGTITTRNPALVLAAAVMGALFALQRRSSGGLQAPVLTHVTWSTLMVRLFPVLYRRLRARNQHDRGGRR